MWYAVARVAVQHQLLQQQAADVPAGEATGSFRVLGQPQSLFRRVLVTCRCRDSTSCTSSRPLTSPRVRPSYACSGACLQYMYYFYFNITQEHACGHPHAQKIECEGRAPKQHLAQVDAPPALGELAEGGVEDAADLARELPVRRQRRVPRVVHELRAPTPMTLRKYGFWWNVSGFLQGAH